MVNQSTSEKWENSAGLETDDVSRYSLAAATYECRQERATPAPLHPWAKGLKSSSPKSGESLRPRPLRYYVVSFAF
jgi:hypothetical protein